MLFVGAILLGIVSVSGNAIQMIGPAILALALVVGSGFALLASKWK